MNYPQLSKPSHDVNDDDRTCGTFSCAQFPYFKLTLDWPNNCFEAKGRVLKLVRIEVERDTSTIYLRACAFTNKKDAYVIPNEQEMTRLRAVRRKAEDKKRKAAEKKKKAKEADKKRKEAAKERRDAKKRGVTIETADEDEEVEEDEEIEGISLY
jgi:hypothetical protein